MMVGLTLMKVASCRIRVRPPNTTTMIAVTTGMIGSWRVMTKETASAASTATMKAAVATKIP